MPPIDLNAYRDFLETAPDAMVVIDADGIIQITDRNKDLIKSRGEWISSIELENVAVGHSDIQEAAVIGMPHDKWGETPCAFVDLRSDVDAVSEQEIIEHCRGNSAHFKAPRKVVFGPLPKTSTGKIRKLELRKRASDL